MIVGPTHGSATKRPESALLMAKFVLKPTSFISIWLKRFDSLDETRRCGSASVFTGVIDSNRLARC